MKKQQGTGLLAILGIAAGAFAWYKYKNMSPEKKQEIRGKVNHVSQQFKDTISNVESSISQKYGEIKNGATREVEDITNR
ncbi:MAG: YtxH domain-containing protein [Aquaticitalea sp.]